MFPPYHFSRVPHRAERLAGQVVQVRDNPDRSAGGQRVTGPAPAQVAGKLYVANPPDLQSVHVPYSDTQDDNAQAACMEALNNVSNQWGQEVMMVISGLKYKKYLDYKNNPKALINPINPAIRYATPKLSDVSSLPRNMADGECDIFTIHPINGLMLGEIKGVGVSQNFSGQSAEQQNQDIVKKVRKAVDQLNKQTTTLRCLIQDLPNIRITRVVMLPNITKEQLRAALATDASLTQVR